MLINQKICETKYIHVYIHVVLNICTSMSIYLYEEKYVV